jgi:hypothetical protein
VFFLNRIHISKTEVAFSGGGGRYDVGKKDMRQNHHHH